MGAKRIGATEWENLVERSEKPVIVEFVTQTCPNCRAMAPVVERLANDYQEKLDFYLLDAQAEQGVAMRYGVQGVPTFKFFCKGRPVAEMVGEVYPPLLERNIKDILERGDECVEKSTRVSYDMTGYG